MHVCLNYVMQYNTILINAINISTNINYSVSFLALLDTARVQRSVSFLGLLRRMPVPILKHRLELQGISHVVSLVSFSDVKAF